MSKVVAQVMKRHIGDQLPLVLGGMPLEGPKPVVNTRLGELLMALRGKDVGAFSLSSTVQQIVMKWPTCFIEQIDVAELIAFVSHMQPTNLWSHMGLLYQQVGDIAHSAPGPVAQGKECLSPR